MRKTMLPWFAALLIVLAAGWATGDVFTNKRTGEKVTGALLGTGKKDGQDCYIVKVAGAEQRLLPQQDWELTGRSAEASPQAKERTRKRVVCFVQVDVPLDAPRSAEVIAKSVDEAAGRRPAAVIMEIDTPGGLVSGAQEICQAIERVKGAKVLAFVKGGQYRGAFSAGALITLACEKVFMAKGTSIGAAAPIVLTDAPDRISQRMTEKTTSAFSATFRALAEKHGRPPAIAAGMVEADLEIREVIVNGKREFVTVERANDLLRAGARPGAWAKQKGKLLSLTATEATGLGIADGVVTSRDALLIEAGLGDCAIADMKTATAVAEAFARDRGTIQELRAAYLAEWRNMLALRRFHILGHYYVPKRDERAFCNACEKCATLCGKVLELAEEQPAIDIDVAALKRVMDYMRECRAHRNIPSTREGDILPPVW